MNQGFCPQCVAPAHEGFIFGKNCGATLRPTVLPSQGLTQEARASTFRNGTDLTPQFNKAEYLGESGVERCAECSQPIADSYYRVNGALFCPRCAFPVRSSLPKDTYAAYVRSRPFGCGAAPIRYGLRPLDFDRRAGSFRRLLTPRTACGYAPIHARLAGSGRVARDARGRQPCLTASGHRSPACSSSRTQVTRYGPRWQGRALG